MIALFLILISIVHSSELDHLGGDIAANILSGSSTVDLIKLYYGKQPMLFPIEKVAEALKQRMQTLDQNELDENKLILLEMYRQSVDGKTIPPYASNKVSEIVQIAVQEQINAKCNGREGCGLSSNTEIASNDLLQALSHFGKYIFIPNSVCHLTLAGLRLTSLWFKFAENSNIRHLYLQQNNFEELNQETFGKYFHDSAAQKLMSLNLVETNLRKIDFDLMFPNITSLIARRCKSLNEIRNIPKSIEDILMQQTNIDKTPQLRFKEQNGSKLKQITCDVYAGDKLKEVMSELHLEKEIKYLEETLFSMEHMALITTVD